MKRLLFALVIVLLLAPPAAAQGPGANRVYLPLVKSDMPETCQRPWRLVEPEATTNHCLNPSAEAAGNFAAVGGGGMARSTTYQHYGLNSYHIQTAADDQGGSLTLLALANAVHYVTLRVRGTLPAAWDWSLDNVHYRAPALVEAIDPDWTLYGLLFPANQANGSTTLYLRQNGAGAGGDFYVDGIQVEAKTYWTTYCDGTQDGCARNGAEHASSSTRSAQSRAGGRLRDFWQDYGFFVEQTAGVGAAASSLGVDNFSLLPGGSLNSIKVEPRQFTLIGRFIANSEEELHRNRQALIRALSHDLVPADADGWQPVRLWYSGAEVEKVVEAYYDGGLEISKMNVSYGPFQVAGESQWRKLAYWTESTPVRFLSPDPFFREVGESAAVLDTTDIGIFRYIAGRLRATGQWNDLNPLADTTAGNIIWSIVRGPNGLIYIGGDFESFNGVAGRDFIAAYNPMTGTWATVGGGGAINQPIDAMMFGPDGLLYIVGEFQNAGPDPAADFIVVYDPATDAFAAVGDPNSGGAAITGVYDLDFDKDGNLIVVGDFTALAGAADYIALWDYANWNAVGAGGTPSPNTVVVDNQNRIFVGGDFADWAGDLDADGLAMWDRLAWSAPGNWTMAPGGAVYRLVITPDNTLFVGGDLSNPAGLITNDIVGFNGTSFFALAGGLDGGLVLDMAYFEGILYVVGSFTNSGDLHFPSNVALWNGSSWAHVDIDPATTADAYSAVAVVNQDPVVQRNADIYFATRKSGYGAYAGLVVANNEGTTEIYPVIKVNKVGYGPATLYQVRNERTGKVLYSDYSLRDGETLAIDLAPSAKSMISDFYGSRPDAVLANSDVGSFTLKPGNNDVTCFVNAEPDEYNDGWLQLDQWEGITGLDENNTDHGRLYVSVIDDGLGSFHVALYNASTRGAGDLVGHTASYNAIGYKTIVADAASGLGGYVYIGVVGPADADIYVDFAFVTAWLTWKDSYLSLD